MKFYQHWIGDYQKATRRLSMTEHGAYRLLLDEYYSTEEPLPASEPLLHRICGAFTVEEQAAVHNVLEMFFVRCDDGWCHERADLEVEKSKLKSTKRKEAGVNGAMSKWGRDREGQENRKKRSERLANARSLATHLPEEWQALCLSLGNRCVKCGSSPVVKDHIIPIYQGGSDGIDNIQPLCRSCNSSKGPDSTDYRPDGWQNAWQNALHLPQPQPQPQSEEPKEKKTRSRFTPPSIEEVQDYCSERRNSVDPQKWHDHYSANGWKRGKTPIVDWKAAVRTWESGTPSRSSAIVIPAASKSQQREERVKQAARDFVGDN